MTCKPLNRSPRHAFLCPDAASQMTGSVLLIDGGCSLFQFDEGK